MTTQSRAHLHGAQVAPRKARLLIDLIRGMRVAEARAQLLFNKKRVSRELVTLLDSAIANATHNHGLLVDTLTIEKAFVDGGPILYRWMPKAQGRATPIRKRTSHITIILSGEVDTTQKKTSKNVKNAPVDGEEVSKEKEKKTSVKIAKKKTTTKKVAATKKQTVKKQSPDNKS